MKNKKLKSKLSTKGKWDKKQGWGYAVPPMPYAGSWKFLVGPQIKTEN